MAAMTARVGIGKIRVVILIIFNIAQFIFTKIVISWLEKGSGVMRI